MKKVFELLELDNQTPGSYGLEIEAEGKHMNIVDDKFWRTEDDGSLRGHYPDSRAEFVLKNPIELEQVDAAVTSLLKHLPDAQFDFSFRTSVHVHMNAQQLTYVQLLNVIYTYLLLEEPLTTYCGKHRKGNRFCLRLADAEGVLRTLGMLFSGTGEHEMHAIPHDEVRYSAINLEALCKYGSLEFRAMRGNADPVIIKTWVSAIDAIKKYAIGKADPMAVYEAYRNSSPTAFLKEVLGDIAGPFQYPRLIKDVQRSFSLSIDLPYKFKDAEEERKNPPKEVKKPKVVGKIPKFAIPPGGMAWGDMQEAPQLFQAILAEQVRKQNAGEW